MQPDLTIVIVSYHVREHLARCLASLQTQHLPNGIEIFVIDNASTDGSAELVRERFPAVTLIANTENVGFARANNQALCRAQGRYWLLLNPDTEIQTGQEPLSELVSFMDAHPRAGACGASLFYPDGTRQHSAFRFPSLAQIYMDLHAVNWRLRESRLNGRYPRTLYERGEPFRIDHPLGATLFMRAETAQQVGLLDEEYFIYAEEIDWCLRCKRAGWEIWCVPSAQFTHHEAQSTRQFRERMFVELWKARFTLFRKHYSRRFNQIASRMVRRNISRQLTQLQATLSSGEISSAEASERTRAYEQVAALAQAAGA